jgi:putative ABC transport system permease protein
MIFRILRETLARRPRRFASAVLAVTVSAALSAALLGVSLDIGDRMAREMRSYGANVLVEPANSALRLEIGGINLSPLTARGAVDEGQLVKLKTIFWKNNIVGFAPFLSAAVQAGGLSVGLTGTWFSKELREPQSGAIFRTGVKTISPWWRVQGEWATDDDPQTAMIGSVLAKRLGLKAGDRLDVRSQGRERTLRVTGLVATGGYEEQQIFVTLETAQELLGIQKGVDKVLVSALVLPDSALRSDLRGLDRKDMTQEQYETWYCSPVMGAVIAQITEALPGTLARPIRQIAEAEGAFLGKLGLLMTVLTAVALIAAALAVMIAMTQAVFERKTEIGLMKALGADHGHVLLIFVSEAGLIGLTGGLLGYLAGLGLTALIARGVFDASVSLQPVVLPVTLALSLGVALAGSLLPVRSAVRLDPVGLLRGR